MKITRLFFPILFCSLLCGAVVFAVNAQKKSGQAAVAGELKKWHRVTLTFDGPSTSEDATPNPFRDYKLEVTFTKGARRVVVPGYYAADGNAGETSATAGNKWRAHFTWDNERKLYYRELIARFAHHPALVWNLGEENTNTDAQRKAFSTYLHELDAYDHPVVIHTFPNQYDQVYNPLLGFPHLEGLSLQMGNMRQTHFETLKWLDRSALGGRNWVVNLDEIGPADHGVLTDAEDPEHNDVRHYALWGNLLAGGAGVEWYFGYKHPHADLNLEDFRSLSMAHSI